MPEHNRGRSAGRHFMNKQSGRSTGIRGGRMTHGRNIIVHAPSVCGDAFENGDILRPGWEERRKLLNEVHRATWDTACSVELDGPCREPVIRGNIVAQGRLRVISRNNRVIVVEPRPIDTSTEVGPFHHTGNGNLQIPSSLGPLPFPSNLIHCEWKHRADRTSEDHHSDHAKPNRRDTP